MNERTTAVRFAVWRDDFFNNDSMATLLWGSRGIIDIRRLMHNGDPETRRLNATDAAIVARADNDRFQYRKNWGNGLAPLCDLLYRNVIAQEHEEQWLRSACTR